MSRQLAVYAGSFDPPTAGHVWMIEQGAALFGELIVALGVNPEKQYLFSVEERLQMLRDCSAHLPNVRVHCFSNQFLIHFAESVGARFVLRGIRSESDYEQERTMRNVNGDLDPDVTTVFLMPPRAIAEVSSSLVRGLVGPAGWEEVVKSYVSADVLEKLRERYEQRT
ncbi:MAG TPA: pantetheine-phosphate adenylyltransferase [Candidatus Solibacter sp.]|nr:pantetheine-phosphate adenylyltransferase [Candidatus Solibacter sp.]